MVYAHSLPDRPETEWEPLADHLEAVGNRAAEFGSVFGWGEVARIAGRLHDIGKCSNEFQAYIAAPREEARRGPDHSTAGAREALAAFPKLGRLLAFGIAGHHAGLADGTDLDRRFDPAQSPIKPYEGWRGHAGPLPPEAALAPTLRGRPGQHAGFAESFLARMLFSCLVDADFLETEAFYARSHGEEVERGGHTPLGILRDRLRGFMATKRSADTPVNALRARVLDHTVEKAELPPGLFTMTVPTGGGKTLASLSFAMEHALKHDLRRVIYVIPFTSIIEQTAEVFREALDTQGDVLEHHATFNWERSTGVKEADSEGPAGLSKLRKASENWDAPVVVTTAVQFFESLFAARTSRCRKLHNLAGAVIVLDEVQTLPVNLLLPCLAAIDELARNYRATIVLCTATQPALRVMDGALPMVQGKKAFGLDIPEERELAPDPQELYTALKRVRVEVRKDPVTDADLAARFAEQPRMLCIVNSRRHARVVFDLIRGLQGATHLTTLMCPRHRRMVLEDVRERLKRGEPVRLVATSLIEAGVDVDFPEVWRATAGLDSIAQAAGRCNREGSLPMGRTVVFTPAEGEPPRSLRAFQQAARQVLREYEDVLGLEAVARYFHELYFVKGVEALDAARLEGQVWPILPAIAERAKTMSFPFDTIARAFRMIDEVMEPVIVPWRAEADDREAEKLLARIAASDRPRAVDLRRLQQYTVSIPRAAREAWLARGAIRAVHPALGDALLCFDGLAHYRPDTGLDLAELGQRSAESNVI